MSQRRNSLMIRLLPHEIQAFREAAEPHGLAVSAWARARLLAAAASERLKPDRDDPDPDEVTRAA